MIRLLFRDRNGSTCWLQTELWVLKHDNWHTCTYGIRSWCLADPLVTCMVYLDLPQPIGDSSPCMLNMLAEWPYKGLHGVKKLEMIRIKSPTQHSSACCYTTSLPFVFCICILFRILSQAYLNYIQMTYKCMQISIYVCINLKGYPMIMIITLTWNLFLQQLIS